MKPATILILISLTLLITLLIASCISYEKADISDNPFQSGSVEKENSQNTGGTTMKVATFETNQGTFKIQLETEKAPITTGNFVKLAESGFYDGTRFHRIIADFMIQGGDPLSKDTAKRSYWGTGDPGYKIKDEFHPDLKNNIGTISMANAGPNTGGSQFFINVANNNFLDGKHPVFGHVIEGMDVINEIANVPTKPGDQPIKDIIIQKIVIS